MCMTEGRSVFYIKNSLGILSYFRLVHHEFIVTLYLKFERTVSNSSVLIRTKISRVIQKLWTYELYGLFLFLIWRINDKYAKEAALIL